MAVHSVSSVCLCRMQCASQSAVCRCSLRCANMLCACKFSGCELFVRCACAVCSLHEHYVRNCRQNTLCSYACLSRVFFTQSCVQQVYCTHALIRFLALCIGVTWEGVHGKQDTCQFAASSLSAVSIHSVCKLRPFCSCLSPVCPHTVPCLSP